MPHLDEALLFLLAPHLEHGCVTREGVHALADRLEISERKAMAYLLESGIWPQRFRRNRAIFTAAEQARLLRCRVFVAGCGGLGGQVLALLARLGVGHLRFCDPDCFEESNLNRQHFCTERALGRPKADVCRAGLLDIASYLEADARVMAVDEKNLPPLLRGVDAVVDGLDSVNGKLMLERAASAAGIPFIHGSVAREEGFAFFAPAGEERLAAMYPDGADASSSPETLVTSVAGVAGIMVCLLLRVLLGRQEGPSALFHFDGSIPELERFEAYTKADGQSFVRRG